ncbi:DNA repair protein RecN [Edwardsiella anguillarum]|nr:DNA repair protein RecN [Edwardsiella anguillarum]
MQAAYRQWHHSVRLLADHRRQISDREARRELLQYQLKELNEFAPQPGEYEQIDEEYKRQANSGQLLSLSQQILAALCDGDDGNALSLVHSARHSLGELISYDARFAPLLEMLEEAAIQIDEAGNELRHYGDSIEMDPARLQQLEQRLSRQIALARKHQVAPEQLPQLHQQLLEELHALDRQQDDEAQLEDTVRQHHQQALSLAQRLHQQRSACAAELCGQISARMQELAMPHGRFTIDVTFTPDALTADGADRIEFRVTTNPGQPLQPLGKVASGGELSRIALAIQVITAQKMDTPALIFDEVDVGISGPTAAIVGRLLRQLGESTQVMCVTHLPQVAGCGHQHYYVSKETDGEETETRMRALNKRRGCRSWRVCWAAARSPAIPANARELLAA